MIYFSSIKPKEGDISIICFKNENGNSVEIPIDNATARIISMYLEKIKTVPNKTVERNNEEKIV